MKPKTLLVLGAVALVLGAFIFFFEKDLPSTDERRQNDKKVLGLEVADISGLTLEAQGQGPVRFERREASGDGSVDSVHEPAADAQDLAHAHDLGHDHDSVHAHGSTHHHGPAAPSADPTRPVEWHLVEPLTTRADAMAVADLLRQLTELEHRRRLDDLDTAAAGLDEPVAKVTFATDDGPTVLRIGAEVPASTDRIVAIDGRPGAQVATVAMLHTIQRAASAWRDKNLVSGLRSEVKEVTLESAEGRVTLSANGDDLWLGEPWNDRADAERTGNLLGALLGLRAETFVDASPLSDDGLGLDPPRSRIELMFEDGRQVEVLLGDPLVPTLGEPAESDTVHARVDGELVTVRPGVLSELALLGVDDWRSTAWSHLEVFQIEGADITVVDGPSFTLQREESAWSRDGEIIDYDAVSDLLYALVESRAVEVMSSQAAVLGGASLQDPQWTLGLRTAGGEETLQLWGPVDGGYAVGSSDRPVVLLLDATTMMQLRDGIDAVAVAQGPSDIESDAEVNEE